MVPPSATEPTDRPNAPHSRFDPPWPPNDVRFTPAGRAHGAVHQPEGTGGWGRGRGAGCRGNGAPAKAPQGCTSSMLAWMSPSDRYPSQTLISSMLPR